MTGSFEYEAGAPVVGTQYRVVQPVGAGGMGAVYEVEDETVGRRFVMKTLHVELRDRPDFVERLQREARILARLNHPNIVQVFTAGVTQDELRLPYYIMEKLEGQNLRRLIEAKRALPLHACLTIAIELLDALDRAHELGVVHRDVKPENLFIHRNGDGTATTKLLDFGIMSLLEGTGPGRGEVTNRFVGTMRYAAPEQARGETPTAATDLYAAGLVIYEMVAGRGPFDEVEDLTALCLAHAATVPPAPSSWGREVPPELEAMILAALAKEPARRPQDAFSMATTLRTLKREHREGGLRVSTLPTMTAPVDAVDRKAETRTAPPMPPVRGAPSSPLRIAPTAASSSATPPPPPSPAHSVARPSAPPLRLDDDLDGSHGGRLGIARAVGAALLLAGATVAVVAVGRGTRGAAPPSTSPPPTVPSVALASSVSTSLTRAAPSSVTSVAPAPAPSTTAPTPAPPAPVRSASPRLRPPGGRKPVPSP